MRSTCPSTAASSTGRRLRRLIPALALLAPLAPQALNAADAEAPAVIPVEMAYDGTLAVTISDAAGKPLRRLCAEDRQPQGTARKDWDLLDDAGTMLPAGSYRWTAITVPKLKHTYEGTVNNAGKPGWWAPPPVKGGGGWLADHSGPSAACRVGDYMFLGAWCAEHGHAALALDKDGEKAWGINNLGGAFAGVERITTDGKYAYLANDMMVARVDPADGFKMTEVLRFAYSPELPAPAYHLGLARNDVTVRGDRLFVAIDAPSNHLHGAVEAGALDFNLCQPPPATRDSSDERDLTSFQKWQSALGLLAAPASTTQAMLGPVFSEGPLAGTVTAVFSKPVPVASLLLSDPSAEVWMLRPEADLTAAGLVKTGPALGDEAGGDDAFNEDLWQPLRTVAAGTKSGSRAVLVAAETPARTRALRFKAKRPLSFAMPFDRRFTDVGAAATVASADGKATPGGGWQVERDPSKMPISATSQAAMVMVWPKAQALRGVALTNPNQAFFAVDVWTGAEAPDAQTCAAKDSWREVGGFQPQMVGPAPQDPTLRLVDFGETVQAAAVRIRAYLPAGSRGYMGFDGLAVAGAHRASCGGVIAFSPLGGDLPDLPPDLSQRISEYQLAADGKATLVRHHVVAHPGHMAVAGDGTLYVQSNDAVVTWDPATGKTVPVIPAGVLSGPSGMTFDRQDRLVITETGRNTVGVYDRAGKFLHRIGSGGRRTVGAFDPLTFTAPCSVGIDREGKVWVVESNNTPKRITRWSADGATLEQQHFGPAQYGGGGWLDARDPSLLYYRGMKFRFDWKTRGSTLESIVYLPGEGPCLRTAEPERPLYVGDRRYLVGDGGAIHGIYVEVDGKAMPVAAAGPLNSWTDVDADPALRARFGMMNRGALGFVWSDRNGDRKAQPDEVQITSASILNVSGAPQTERIGDDLSFHFQNARLRPTGINADGVPLYDIAKLETGLPNGWGWGMADGSTLLVAGDGVRFTGPDGTSTKWFYADEFAGVHGSHKTGYDRKPGMLVGSLFPAGHITVGEKPEELYVVAGNHGDWFAFTADGMLATCLAGGPLTYGKRWWSVPEFAPGKTDLSDLCLGEEHFGGSVSRTSDGRVLMVAGHNHNSIVRVDGLERLRRLTGTITVTPEAVKRASAYILQRQLAERARLGERVLTMPLLEAAKIQVDGRLGEWNTSHFVTIEDRYDDTNKRTVVMSSGGLMADAEHLYIAGTVSEDGLLRNAAADPTEAFKAGDAFDVTLGLDQAAKRGRTEPVAGDLRILLVPWKDRPLAVLYQPVVAGTPPDKRRVFAFTGRTELDRVAVLDEASVSFARTATGWTVEAAIPWSALGVEPPEAGQKLLADVGLLKSDQNGVSTVMRAYWTGKSQTVVSDIGFEARVTPALWGDLKVVAEEAPDLGADDVKAR